MSGSLESNGLGAKCNDLETDAEPDLSLPGSPSAGLVQAEPSSTACSGEISSRSIPEEQQEEENSTAAEAKLSGARQTDQLRTPDGPSTLTADNFQPRTTEFARQQSLQIKGYTDDQKQAPSRVFLPPELKLEHFDILIIYSEEDMQAVEDLKKIIEELHAERMDGVKTPITVGLMGEVASYVRSNIDWLDTALSCCTYIFVIFTPHLKNDPVLSEMIRASLWATFSEEKKNKFCPVYLERGAKEVLQLSPFIKQLRSVNLWKQSSSYKAQIEKYIDVVPRIERCRLQAEEIKRYCKQQEDTTSAETRCEFHDNRVSTATELQQISRPLLCNAKVSGFLEEDTPVWNKEVATDNSNEHSSHADSKSCQPTPESCDEKSFLHNTCEVKAPTEGEPCSAVENSAQTSRDWDRCGVLMIGVGAVVTGVALVFLFRK